MDFEELETLFRNHADIILQDKTDKTRQFRARNYNRVANLINLKYSKKEKVTPQKIIDLGLTNYMTGVALNALKTRKIDTKHNRSSSRSSSRPSSRSSSRSSSRKSSSQNTNKLLNQLINFMGIGEVKAQQLIDEGLKHINQLHMKKWLKKLPEETQLFMSLKPIRSIPHEDIKQIEKKIMQLEAPDMKIQFVGSYRRQTKISKDIDVMLISKKENILEIFIKKLKHLFNNKVYPYNLGPDKISLLIDVQSLLHKAQPTIYKMDVFRVLPQHKIPMLLYSTGSKDFNIIMRGKAKKKGYLLNQHGLFKIGNDKPIPNLKSEKDYFHILDMPYLSPKDRV